MIIDYTKLTTERLLAYKRKHFPYYNLNCPFRGSTSISCQDDWCEESDRSRCEEYWAETEKIKAELAKREHIEKRNRD